jgi:adenylylsulfate kinase
LNLPKGRPAQDPAAANIDSPSRTANMSFTIWFTGISGSGKTTLAKALVPALTGHGLKVEFLDGDIIRSLAGNSLGFSRQDRQRNIHNLGVMSYLLNKHGVVSVVAAIAPYAGSRQRNRDLIPRYVEVFCDCNVRDAAESDVKGLYARALAGDLPEFTGVSAPYEEPENPEVRIFTYREPREVSFNRVLGHLAGNNLLPGGPSVASPFTMAGQIMPTGNGKRAASS